MRITLKKIHNIKRKSNSLRAKFYYTKTDIKGNTKRFYRSKQCGQKFIGTLYISCIDNQNGFIELKCDKTSQEFTLYPNHTFLSTQNYVLTMG